MTIQFTITPTPPTSIKLERGQQGKLSFTVTSLAAPEKTHDVILQALVVGPDGKGKEVDWLVAGPHKALSMTGGKTETVTITARPTAASPQGENVIKLAIADKARPNDDYAYSAAVVCDVLGEAKPPIKRPPLWLIPVIAGALLLIGGSAWAIWRLVRTELPVLGESCATEGRCAADLVCVPGVQKCLLPGAASCDPAKAELCASGECKSKTEVCAIPLGDACDPEGKDALLCPKRSSCDKTTKTCTKDIPACTAGARQCTPDGRGSRTCGDDGNWSTETVACPPTAPACRDGTCQCAADKGRICNCSGTIQCDGTCSAPACTTACNNGRCLPAAPGTPCGACDGVVKTDGTCSKPDPPNLGQPCADCGGTIQCDGKCSKLNPPNFAAPCGSCGGTVQCDGTCSKPNPPGFGQPCGSCGGRLQCDGTCSKPNPANFGRPCGECGGTITCTGSCSNTTPRCPAGYVVDGGQCRSPEQQIYQQQLSIGGAVWDRCDPCGCGLSFDKTVAIACGAGRSQSSYSIAKVSGGNAQCSGVWANNSNPSDCSVRIHVGTSWCDNFKCGVTVRSVIRRPQCRP